MIGESPIPRECEHHKPGTFVRLDLIPDYRARGLVCRHGYMTDADRWYRDNVEEHGRSFAAIRADVQNLEPFDEHECGQLRLAAAGEQVPLLPLPDSLIPHDNPERIDR